jgi:uncharacterized membrane protein HdeD (DUF308 family)
MIMLEDLKNYWWLVLLRGIVALLFGIFTLLNPALTAVTLVIAFGSYAVVSGVLTLAFALFSKAASHHRAMLGVQGGLQALLGVLVLAWPGITMLSLLSAIIAFAFLGGIAEIVMAFQARNFWLGLSGLASVLFGIYAFRFPGDGALTILLLIGVYAVAAGVMLILGSFQVRRISHNLFGHAA